MLASVVILTFNGETYLERLLAAVAEQEIEGDFEVMVIDSGSTDGTLDILARHPEVVLETIPNSEFSHGRTRQRAAAQAKGRYIAFLTQDAVPIGARWLAELLAPFAIDERIALVTGRQVPRLRAFPLQKYEIVSAFARLGPDAGITVYGAQAAPLSAAEASTAAFHSDVNAAVRRDLVMSSLPFRDVPYAEDQMMGRDALDGGWWKAYAGRAVVEHSNDLALAEYRRRIFDETVGLRRIGTPILPLSRISQAKLTLRGVVGDSLRILRDPAMTMPRRLAWLVRNPAYHAVKWASYAKASRVDLNDDDVIGRSSLEASRRP